MADRNAPASFTFEEWRVEFNELATDVGDIANLPATVNGNAVTDVIEAVQQLELALSTVMFPTVIDFDDSTGVGSERIKFGDDDDLQIYHDGSHSYVNHNGTGDLLITGNNDVDVTATTDIGITGGGDISMSGGGNVLVNGVTGVDVQYNGTTRFSSTNTGLGISGDIVDSSGGMTGSLTLPNLGGTIATEGFGIALAIALG